MKQVKFVISLCGMGAGDLFAENVMIWGPYKQLIIYYPSQELKNERIRRVSDLIEYLKTDEDMLHLDEWGIESFVYNHVFVNHEGDLYRLTEDKKISDLFRDFPEKDIELHYIEIVGGVSIECRGFLFIVHPDEAVHRYSPHVHVENDEYSARYSLETLQLIDANSKKAEGFFRRSEKKIIRPFLEKNHNWFMNAWNMYQKGYEPPTINEEGMQYPNW